MAEKRFEYRYATEDELEEMKQREFTGWMFTYVCYIKYPRVRNRDDPWVTVTRLNPRGRVQGSSELEDPLQPSTSGNCSAAENLAGVGLVVDLTDFGEEAVVHVEDEPVIGEFHQFPRNSLGIFRGNSEELRVFHRVEPDILPRFSLPLSLPTSSASRSPSLAIPLRLTLSLRQIQLRLTLSLRPSASSLSARAPPLSPHADHRLSASRRAPPLRLLPISITYHSVPKKKGRLVGLGRRTRSVPSSSAPPPFVDPEVGYEAQKRLNQQMMEMIQRMYPNESVPKKKGRLVGLGRRTRSVPPSSAPPPFVDPEVLTAQLKDKDDRISLLETQMAAQQAGYEAQRRLKQQMMEMMQMMYPNEVFPDEPEDP
uniref:Uncharacterized protein n=1 Tax=Brassica oleracea var. oleracea TaxID=109376 RepID=A0A0D3CVF6_BRAOL